jgi:putative tryptophan/tyrosine transport system substrate-binding protein
MRRREFLGVAGGAAAWPLAAGAQQQSRFVRVGYLTSGVLAARSNFLNAFRAGMRDFGYEEGRNLVLIMRGADGDFELLPRLAEELLRDKPDVLLVSTTPGILAAKAATSTVPIVMIGPDPIGLGLVASLARPGGNITGITNSTAELTGKRLQILKELLPAVSRVAVLVNPTDQNTNLQMERAREVAKHLGIQLDPVLPLREAADLEPSFAALVNAGAKAAIRMVDPLTSVFRQRTVELALSHRLSVMFAFREDVAAGGLISYGTDFPAQYRQAARFVHRILDGAKPSDLPIEQPTRLELVINLKTARVLGLTVPPLLLARADEVIE